MTKRKSEIKTDDTQEQEKPTTLPEPVEIKEPETVSGVAWEKIELVADPDLLAENLRAAGIYTYFDLIKNPNVAIGVLQATYQVDLAALLKFAREEE